jgi:HAD superfamily hydrolase (TIGR01549 family)
MIKNVIFDADGVLLLSTQAGINSFLQAVKESSLPVPDFQEIRLIWGRRLRADILPTLARQFSWPEGGEKVVLDKYLEISRNTSFPRQEGLIEMLTFLSKKYRLGIVSNRDSESLYWRLKQQKIPTDFFVHIHAADGTSVFKPDPAVFDYFWNGPGFDPSQTLFVGDSIEHDLRAAQAHNPPLKFVAITSGLHTMGDFVKEGIRLPYILKSVVNLPGIISTL